MSDWNGQKPEQVPPGGMQVGNRVVYPDIQGNIHNSPQDAIRSNQMIEGDFSRGSSGGCGQDADLIRGDFGNDR